MYVPVFVYGNEQARFSQHQLLLGAAKLGYGRTVNRNFVMVKDKDWNVPLVFQRNGVPNNSAVAGELYLCCPEAVFSLDDHHERGRYSVRYRLPITHYFLSDKDQADRPWYTVNAFVYVNVYTNFVESIKNGDRFENVRLVMDSLSNMTIYKWFDNDDQPNRDKKARTLALQKEVYSQIQTAQGVTT
jgi:hypothetical protein